MKILEVYACFLPNIGGIETHIYDLCKHLVERGHKPVVLTYGPSQPSLQIIEGIVVHRFSMPRVFARDPIPRYPVARFPMVLYLSLRIICLARRYGIDVIHAHHYPWGLASVLAGQVLNKPVVVTIHGPLWAYRIEPVLKQYFLHSVQAIICVSKFAYQEIQKRGFPISKMKVIHNWLAQLPTCESSLSIDVLRKFGLDKKNYILSVGRLVDYHKGFSMLISALKLLITKGYDLNLAIAGEGPDKEMLMKHSFKLKVDNRIHLLGHVSNAELACLYTWCDLFVLSSLIEGLPLVLLEAMSFGKPVVATKIGGITEVIEDDKNGILVDLKPRALADGIEKLLLDPHLKEMFSKRSRETIHKMFSKNNCYATIDLLEMTAKRWKRD